MRRHWIVGLAVVAALVLVIVAVERPAAMPDLTGMEIVSERKGFCPSTGAVIVQVDFVNYDTKRYLAAYYLPGEDQDYGRPFAIAEFSEAGIKVYTDENRDGRVDAVGVPGDEVAGNGPCDVVERMVNKGLAKDMKRERL